MTALITDTTADLSVHDDRATVLVVDDTPANLTLMANALASHWRVKLANSGAKALELARRRTPDVILLDIMMPGMDGYETCRRLKSEPTLEDVPVLFLTAMTQPEDERRGFACGGADFIHKPFNPDTVVARVRTHIEAKIGRDALRSREQWLQAELDTRLSEVHALRDASLHLMSAFAECRDANASLHVLRTREYVRLLATRLNDMPAPSRHLSPRELEQVVQATPLHDLGKVTIPDRVLLKPGPLDEAERALMETHTVRGWEMLRLAARLMGDGGGDHLRIGMQIARSHHERWDGTGYPDGLCGEDIPLAARLMAVADVYDTLVGTRCYKDAVEHADACAYIAANAGTQFDPVVVEAFLTCRDRFRAVTLEVREEVELDMQTRIGSNA